MKYKYVKNRMRKQHVVITITVVAIVVVVGLVIGFTLLGVPSSFRSDQQLFKCDSDQMACVPATMDEIDECGKTVDCFSTPSECTCWACVPQTGSPQPDQEQPADYPFSVGGGKCAFSSNKMERPKFHTEEECKLDGSVKCGWMYSCD